MASFSRRLSRFVITKVKPFTRSPRVQLATAIVLILTGLCEIFEDVAFELLGWKVGIEHGVLLFATMNALYALVQIVEGLEGLELGKLEGKVAEVSKEVDGLVEESRRDGGESPGGIEPQRRRER